jgi:cytosine deaminase
MLIGYRQGLLADCDLELAFDLANGAAAEVLGFADHGLRVGAAADLVAIPAGSIAEAVAAHPARTLVMKRGRIVARDGCLTATMASAGS